MSSSYVTLHLTLTYSAATSSAFDFVSWRPLRPPRRYPWIMARGRSSSSSPEAHRHRGKRDRRTSRRSRSPRRKSTGLPVETPPSTSSFETRYPIPKAWSPDDIYLDRQQEYKLTLPRRVVATAWSRDLLIDHQPIEDVRLIDVLSRKQENWTLMLAAGWYNSRDSGIVKRPISGLPCLARSSRALMLTSPASSVTFILLLSRMTGMRNARVWIALLNVSLIIYEIRCPRTLPRLFRTRWTPAVLPHLLSVIRNLRLPLIVNAYVWTNPNHSSPLQLLLARDALWTLTSNPLHLNRRRLLHLLLSLLIHFMTILSAPIDRYWRTTLQSQLLRLALTSGSKPISRTRLA